ncbi:MAG: DUF2309 family protein [Deltaproteobacteria bacterium]|nr:DUF2309 family protein [Deltaproteobacteria bacterium]
MLPRAHLIAALEHAAHLLPTQNPLEHFVHHNPLHAFEALPFHEAVERAANLTGARPWPTMRFFQQAWEQGRVLQRDLDDVLQREVRDDVVDLPGLRLPRREVMRLLMLAPETGLHAPEASAWAVHEGGSLDTLPAGLDRCAAERLRSAGPTSEVLHALWDGCARLAPDAATGRDGDAPARLGVLSARHLGADLDALVEPLLTRWAAAFLDVGQADWAMPGRAAGFYACGLQLMRAWGTALLPGGRWLRRQAKRLQAEGVDAAASVEESLRDLGFGSAALPAEAAEGFVLETLLALPGFGGMFERLAERPDLAPTSGNPPRAGDVALPPTRVLDLLAVRLLLERATLRWLLAERGIRATDVGLLPQLRAMRVDRIDPYAEIRRVAPTFHVALSVGLQPAALDRARDAERRALRTLADRRTEWQLRWLWQLAYERRYRAQVLDALLLHGRASHRHARPLAPHTQLFACIDDREESLRRHLEELDPGYATFGYVGFYGVAMRHFPVGSSHGRSLCPAPRRPTHALVEQPTEGSADAGRGPLGGIRAWLGMGARLLRPDASDAAVAQTHRAAPTRLPIERDPTAGLRDGLPVGYEPGEMAQIVGHVLAEAGLTEGFAALVVLLGHGSSSVNNPHAAGYNCGACAGGSGGPNARAFAAMANRDDVRRMLAERGLSIPATTRFLGGLHDTATDGIQLYDADDPGDAVRTQGEAIARLRRDLDICAGRDAHERTRRFLSAPLDLDEAGAQRHVVGRTRDLAQARPEYNHATNALCVVGRRSLTRGLFLDRRAFLVSYDPVAAGVDDGSRLGALLASVGPVGAGINLEYFFSFVDNERYGAGTKLPHNVVGLVAVMNGASSDLRTGLVEQMIEIHEPMRLLTVVEASPEVAARAAAADPAVQRLVAQRWLLVACVDPSDGKAYFLENDGFVEHRPEVDRLPMVAVSRDGYGGRRGSLPPFAVAAPRRVA